MASTRVEDNDGADAHHFAHDTESGAQREKDLATVTDESEGSSVKSDGDSIQTGVKRIEAVSQTWSKWSLITAYASIFLMAFCTSLEGQTVISLFPYATSSFNQLGLMSAVGVVQGVVYAVIKPPMAKIANVFGRLEAFSISVLLYVLGYIQMAASRNIQTYAAAQIFYSAGNTGLQVLQQIFVADTSDLLNRALWSSLPDIPFLVTVWIGPFVGASILKGPTWRWGYGIWTIVLPLAFLPLALSLYISSRKAKKLNLLPPAPWAEDGVAKFLKDLWFELDVSGLLLLSAAVALILLPLTLAPRANGGWSNPSMIAMIVIGCICLVAFPLHEGNKRIAPRPVLPFHLLKERTIVGGFGVAFFYFMAFYLSIFPYFFTYMQVVQGASVIAAGHVTQTFSFTATVSSIATSFLIKYTKRYKYYVIGGSCIYLLGLGLMVRYREEGSSLGSIVGTQIAVGIGGGMLNVPAQLGVQAAASHQDVATATALFLMILEIGGAIGAAISGAIWSSHIPAKLALYLPPETQDQAINIFGNITAATSYPFGSPERIAINRAYQETMRTLLIIACCVCVPIIGFASIMKNYKLDEIDQRVKGKVIGNLSKGSAPEPEAFDEQNVSTTTKGGEATA